MKSTIGIIVAIVIIVGAFWAYSAYAPVKTATSGVTDPKNLTVTISGTPVTLSNGTASTAAAPGSASMTTTTYFGNEARGDINGDGVEDVSFLITQSSGGSGTFFYLVGAIKVGAGYVGTNAMLIGDRIAPQTTEYRMLAAPYGARIIVNYADRKPGEPMSAQPSVGKSLYAKYDPATNSFGEVVQNFEGESR